MQLLNILVLLASLSLILCSSNNNNIQPYITLNDKIHENDVMNAVMMAHMIDEIQSAKDALKRYQTDLIRPTSAPLKPVEGTIVSMPPLLSTWLADHNNKSSTSIANNNNNNTIGTNDDNNMKIPDPTHPPVHRTPITLSTEYNFTEDATKPAVVRAQAPMMPWLKPNKIAPLPTDKQQHNSTSINTTTNNNIEPLMTAPPIKKHIHETRMIPVKRKHIEYTVSVTSLGPDPNSATGGEILVQRRHPHVVHSIEMKRVRVHHHHHRLSSSVKPPRHYHSRTLFPDQQTRLGVYPLKRAYEHHHHRNPHPKRRHNFHNPYDWHPKPVRNEQQHKHNNNNNNNKPKDILRHEHTTYGASMYIRRN